MKIALEYGGGFLGDTDNFTVDTTLMSSEEAEKLHGFVNESNFFELNTYFPPSVYARDHTSYRLTVELDNKIHSISFTDVSMPPIIDNLVNYLISRRKGVS